MRSHSLYRFSRSQAPLGNAALVAPASRDTTSWSLPAIGSQAGAWEPAKRSEYHGRQPAKTRHPFAENGVVMWENGLDLAPDTLHREIQRNGNRHYVVNAVRRNSGTPRIVPNGKKLPMPQPGTDCSRKPTQSFPPPFPIASRNNRHHHNTTRNATFL